MAPKRKALDEAAAQKLLEQFLTTAEDVPTVHNVDQGMELHVVGTSAYVTSYTRQQWDQSFGGPVQAVKTRTNKESKTVFIYPADNPKEPKARRLRCDDISGPSFFAFGVPLKELGIKVPPKRRINLPMEAMEAEGRTVYWVSFAAYEKEYRKLAAGGTNTTATTAPGQQGKRRTKGQETAESNP